MKTKQIVILVIVILSFSLPVFGRGNVENVEIAKIEKKIAEETAKKMALQKSLDSAIKKEIKVSENLEEVELLYKEAERQHSHAVTALNLASQGLARLVNYEDLGSAKKNLLTATDKKCLALKALNEAEKVYAKLKIEKESSEEEIKKGLELVETSNKLIKEYSIKILKIKEDLLLRRIESERVALENIKREIKNLSN